jgi:hypothetical protein
VIFAAKALISAIASSLRSPLSKLAGNAKAEMEKSVALHSNEAFMVLRRRGTGKKVREKLETDVQKVKDYL